MQGAAVLIRVTVEHDDDKIGRIEIERVGGDEHSADYHVKAMIERPDGDFAMHHRTILNHPRGALNAFGLVTAALAALGYDPMKASESDDQPDLPR